MKTTILLNCKKEPFLKVIKNSLKNKSVNHRKRINTLTPNFSFKNNKGEIITSFDSKL